MNIRFLMGAAVAACGLLVSGLALAQTATGVGNALTGQSLFDANCKLCHGNTNPAVGTLNVQKATTATALQAAITTTSPTMKMVPTLAALSATQLADIAAYVAADVSAAATGNVVNGRLIYASSCAVCHGAAPASGVARVNLGVSAAVIQNAMVKFPVAMGPSAINAAGSPYALRFNLSATQLDDVAAFIVADVAAGTPSTMADRGHTLHMAMCSRCHGGVYSKAANAAKTLSAIARNKGGMGTLGFVTADQAADIAAYNAVGGGGGGGGGGCTLGAADQAADPLWWLMLAGALGILGLRRVAKA